MKAVLAVLLTTFTALVAGEDLDYLCRDSEPFSVLTDSYRFTIMDNSAFIHRCTIKFVSSNVVRITLTGFMPPRSECAVDVYNDVERLGQMESDGSTFQGNEANPYLYLHIQGPFCANTAYNPVFTVNNVCQSSSEFQCTDGACVGRIDVCDGYDDCSDGSDEANCFWSVGTYIGLAAGGVFFVALVASVSVIFYRRRMVYVARSPMLIPGDQCMATENSLGNPVVVHSRW